MINNKNSLFNHVMGEIGMREPDFSNMQAVLRRERPKRPVLFELFFNPLLYRMLAPDIEPTGEPFALDYRLSIHAYRNAGYDYASLTAAPFMFPKNNVSQKQSISINNGIITDQKSFEAYPFPDPEKFDYNLLERCGKELSDGMKIGVFCPAGGVLEAVVSLVGYDNLCYMLLDEPDLVEEIFNTVGSRILRYYEICVPHDSVGFLIANDDWGFNASTLLSSHDLRRFVFPWYKRIIQNAHKHGKPVILHSCGQLEAVFEDIIEDMQFDGKHSYEDKILPVEQAYERWGKRIAIIGGLDVDFIVRSTPKEVYARARAMLERSLEKGSYALGTGNSVPDYIPVENFFAMTSAVFDWK